MMASTSSVGACLDNAVVDLFFGSLNNEWLLNIAHLTREIMKMAVKDISVITTMNDFMQHSAI